MGDVDEAAEVVQMRHEGVVDADLADGRAQRGDGKAAVLKARVDGFGFRRGVFGYVFAVDAAGFDVMDIEAVEHVHLDGERGIDLVGKAGKREFCHGDRPFTSSSPA